MYQATFDCTTVLPLTLPFQPARIAAMVSFSMTHQPRSTRSDAVACSMKNSMSSSSKPRATAIRWTESRNVLSHILAVSITAGGASDSEKPCDCQVSGDS